VRRGTFGNAGLLAAGAAGSLAAGMAVAQRPVLAASLVGVAVAAVLVLLRPRAALLILVGGLVAAGRTISHVRVGPVYLAEAGLVSLLAASLLAARVERDRHGRALVWWTTGFLACAAIALVLRTDLGAHAWARNFALVYYVLFAVVAQRLAADERFFRHLGRVVLGAGALALILVFSGHSGTAQDVTTSTGAVRIAHTSYVVPFGVAPLLIIAGVQGRILRTRWLLAVAPFLLGLILMNYRSSWIAFLLAVVTLFVRRPGKLAVWAAVAAVLAVAVAMLGAGAFGGTATLGREMTRIGTTVNLNDPNAQYRLAYWRNLLGPALRDPIIGHGFDSYDPRLIPPRQTCRTGPGKCVDPHNSFVALAYRIGLLATAAILLGLGGLLIRAVRVARAVYGWRGVSANALAAVVVYLGVFSGFNVGLELPYFAVVFWCAVGALAAVTSKQYRDVRTAAV